MAAAPAAAADESAQPASLSVLVSGDKTSFQTYSINGSSYLKLRDLAMALKGTDKEFAVKYDGVRKAVIITSGQSRLRSMEVRLKTNIPLMHKFIYF